MSQLDIFQARQNRDAGMQRALDHANAVHEDWSKVAYEFLVGYARCNAKFMMEDVRFASQGIVPVPKSQRAWGGLVRKALKENIMHNDNNEYGQVKNANANCANAAIWKSKIYQYHKKVI